MPKLSPSFPSPSLSFPGAWARRCWRRSARCPWSSRWCSAPGGDGAPRAAMKSSRRRRRAFVFSFFSFFVFVFLFFSSSSSFLFFFPFCLSFLLLSFFVFLFFSSFFFCGFCVQHPTFDLLSRLVFFGVQRPTFWSPVLPVSLWTMRGTLRMSHWRSHKSLTSPNGFGSLWLPRMATHTKGSDGNTRAGRKKSRNPCFRAEEWSPSQELEGTWSFF